MQWFGAEVEKKILNGAMKGLMKGAQVVVGEAQKNCPVKSGTLQRSITATQGGLPNAEEIYSQAKTSSVPVQNESKGQEIAAYVSANTPYARKQHEEHSSKAKFLERGLQTVGSKIPEMVEKEIKKAL